MTTTHSHTNRRRHGKEQWETVQLITTGGRTGRRDNTAPYERHLVDAESRPGSWNPGWGIDPASDSKDPRLYFGFLTLPVYKVHTATMTHVQLQPQCIGFQQFISTLTGLLNRLDFKPWQTHCLWILVSGQHAFAYLPIGYNWFCLVYQCRPGLCSLLAKDNDTDNARWCYRFSYQCLISK